MRDLAASGDADASALFLDAGRFLGRSVAAVVNLLAPEVVIVSGEGTESWPFLAPGFAESYEDGRLPFHRDVDVVVDPWDDLNWARGAVSLLTRSLFSPAAGDRVERWVRSRLASHDGGADDALEVVGDGR